MNLKNLIKAAGYKNKKEFAEDIGMAPETVYAWKDNPPTLVVKFLKEKIK